MRQPNKLDLLPLALSVFLAATWAASGGLTGPARDPAQQKADAPRVADPEVIDAQGYQKLLERHRGKPLMVYFWATWCEPCRVEFPIVNELARAYQTRGLVVVGVSLDEDGEMNLVRRFLARTNPVFVNYRKKPGRNREFHQTVHPKWSGAIPATFFYDAEGKQVRSLFGENKRETFEKAIEELLRGAPKTEVGNATKN